MEYSVGAVEIKEHWSKCWWSSSGKTGTAVFNLNWMQKKSEPLYLLSPFCVFFFLFLLLNWPLLLTPRKKKQIFNISLICETENSLQEHCWTVFSGQNRFAHTSVNAIDLHKNENIKIKNCIVLRHWIDPVDNWTAVKETNSSNSISCYLWHMECRVMLTNNKQSWQVQYLLNSTGILRAFCDPVVANWNTGTPISLMEVQSTSVLVRDQC